jgi:hypothetical protein
MMHSSLAGSRGKGKILIGALLVFNVLRVEKCSVLVQKDFHKDI